MTTLYTFWVSHFSEKVRWTLEMEKIAFVERRLLPGLHSMTVRRHAPLNQVPLLCHEGKALQGSDTIVNALPSVFGASSLQPWANANENSDTQLARCTELEALADRCFGQGIQSVVYEILIDHKSHLIDLWNYRGPWWGGLFYTLSFPGIRKFLKANYCSNAKQALRDLTEGFDTFDAILADQPYLLGPSLTRVDITTAALLAPLVRPVEHPMDWPEYPDALVSLADSFRGRPTWAFVERMYRQHR